MKTNKYHILKSVVTLCVMVLTIGCQTTSEPQPHTELPSLLDSIGHFETTNYLDFNRIDSFKSKILTLNKNGVHLRNKSEISDALKLHFEAYQLARKINDTMGKIVSLNNIGTDLRRSGSNIEATKYHLEALQLAKLDTTFFKSEAIASNGLGNVYISLKKPDDAIRYFERSLHIETSLNSGLGKAINYANMGEAYRIQGNTDKAMEFYQLSLDENVQLNNPLGEAICLASMGEVYLDLGHNTLAKNHAKQALEKLEGINDLYHHIMISFTLCQAYISLNEIDEASVLIASILKETQQLKSYILIKKAYGLMVTIYKRQNAFDAALDAKELETVYNDSTNKTANEVKIIELEAIYRNKEAQQHINYLTKENTLTKQTRKDQFLIFVLISVLLSVLLLFFYYAYRKRRLINDELRRVNDIKSRFFNNITHEFKTPLTLIKGPIQQLLKKATKQDDQELLKLVEKNSNILLNLVDKTLNLSRIEANTFEVYYQEGNLKALLNQCFLTFNYAAKDKQLKFHILLEETGFVKLDKTIITLLVNNLMSNAIKYTPPFGVIKVLGVCNTTSYTLSVTNTVHKTNINIDKLFDRYYTNPSENTQGTGIGLALVKELSALYQAPISVHYEPGDSIEFSIDFPTHCTQLNRLETANQNVSQTEDACFDDQKPILLIAEDNADMRFYFKSIFVDEFNVIEAEHGQEALDNALACIPDVVLSDVMMPVMDGLDLCNALKSNPNTNHIPILLISAVSEKNIVLEAYNIQADDYIVKPFTGDVLLSKVTNLIKIRELLKAKYLKSLEEEPTISLFNTQDSFQKLLKDIVEDDLLDTEFNVEEFCKKIHMSRSQLHRKLTALFGMSATEFIRFYRLKKAKELLKTTGMNVTEVCFACGFNSPAYFSKHFKAMQGLTPKEYQKQSKSSDAHNI